MNPKTNKQAWDAVIKDLEWYLDMSEGVPMFLTAYDVALGIVKQHMPRSNDRTVTKAKRGKK